MKRKLEIGILILIGLNLCILGFYKYYERQQDDMDYDRMNYITQIVQKLSHQNFNQSEKQIDHDMPPVGRIEDTKTLSHGTAFIIDDHTIITNFHVIKDGLKDKGLKHFEFTPHKKPAEFKHNEYVPPFTTTITEKHKINGADLVVLKTKKNLHQFGKIKLANHAPKKYEETTSFGYPNPKYNKNINDVEMTRTVYRFITKDTHRGKFYVKGVIHPGSSGSPMLNNKGEAYGVASFRHTNNIKQGISGGYLLNDRIIKDINHYKERFK